MRARAGPRNESANDASPGNIGGLDRPASPNPESPRTIDTDGNTVVSKSGGLDSVGPEQTKFGNPQLARFPGG